MFERLLVVGGDERAKVLASLPEVGRMWVSTLGLDEGDGERGNIGKADAIMFPYPFSVKNGRVPSLCGAGIDAHKILLSAKDGIKVIVGAGMDDVLARDDVKAKGFTVRRYADDAAFLRANAEISAEAAVFETMKRVDKTLADCVIAITGYGLFGRAIARKLICMGAVVWVAARRDEQRLLAAGDGAHPLPLEELHFITPSADALINTIPAPVLAERALMLLKAGAPILELASAPYGADLSHIDRYQLSYELLPALPSHYAPVSAARALLKAAMRLLSEDVL